MRRFRYKKNIQVRYEQQRAIWAISRAYGDLEPGKQAEMRNICQVAGGEYADALFTFVTTNCGGEQVCREYYLSRQTLVRMVRRYYIRAASAGLDREGL